ncbi:Uncharacterised protein [Mycobacteroides abscessus subsp. massiliense]|nr:Uncharacterised protein [Mycobacteroides abscessus subsp. massiliense]
MNHISEYALCQSRNPDNRCSPDVRITRSGSGCPEVYKFSEMASTVTACTNCSAVAPLASSLFSRVRTASVISCLPP